MNAGFKPLIILILTFILLAGTVSLLLPLDEVPDEKSHFDLIRFVAEEKRFPQNNQERLAIGNKGDAAPFYHGLVAQLTQHVDISALPERHHISESRQFIPFDTILTTRNLHTEDELFPFRGIVLAWHLARFVSIFLSAVTLLAIYLTIQLIYPLRPYFALAAAGLAAFVPRFVINSAVLNDDNLVIPLITFVLYCLMKVIQGDTRLRTLLMLGVLSGAAVIAKYHSLVLLPEITLIFAMLARQKNEGGSVWLKRWLWVMVGFILATAWWFYYLFSQFNQVVELGLLQGLLAPLGDPTTTALPNLWTTTISWDWIVPVFRSFWLVAGALLVYGPDYIYQILTILTLIAGCGLIHSTYQGSSQQSPWRLEIILLALHFFFYAGIVFGRYQIFFADNGAPPPFSTQGRHLYPALVSIVFFYILGWQAILSALMSLIKWRNQLRLDQGLAFIITTGFFAFSLIAFFTIVRPIYFPFLPITLREPEAVNIEHRVDIRLDNELHLVGYNVRPITPAGNQLSIELNWLADTTYDQDYLASLCLRDSQGKIISCQWGHPANGLYPMRAWDLDYLVRDQRTLPLPTCLDPAQYELTLSAWPLSGHTASAFIEAAMPASETFSLGTAFISTANNQTNIIETTNDGLQLCANGQCYQQGQIAVKQMRQTVVLVSEKTQPNTQVDDTYYFQSNDNPAVTWQGFQDSVTYQCAAGQIFTTQTFLVDELLARGTYNLMVNDQPADNFTVQVVTRPRNFEPPLVQTPQTWSFVDALHLIGYDVDLSPRYPDQPITATTYWQGQTRMATNYNLALHLMDNTQTTRAFSDRLMGDLYPNVLWAPGEYVQDKQTLTPVTSLGPGLYKLELRVYDHGQDLFQPLMPKDLNIGLPLTTNIALGQLRIMDPARTSMPTTRLAATLNNEITLHGFDMEVDSLVAGDEVEFRLYWQAISQPSTDYTVFAQLIDPHGRLIAQQDNQPQRGRFPTSQWPIKDTIVDSYAILIPADTQPGIYQLYIGMYDLATGKRTLTVDEQGQSIDNDAILLQTIEFVSRL